MTAWQEVALGELGIIVTGGTPPKRHPEWFGETTPFITPSDIDNSRRRCRAGRMLSEEGTQAFSRRLIPSGSVCFVCIGLIGKVCLTDSPAVTNQQINTVIPGSACDGTFLYYLLRHEAPRIASTAGGAATPIINKSDFAATLVKVPDVHTQRRVGAALGSFDDLLENGQDQLMAMRDLLLPKLVTGRIDVSAVELEGYLT